MGMENDDMYRRGGMDGRQAGTRRDLLIQTIVLYCVCVVLQC